MQGLVYVCTLCHVLSGEDPPVDRLRAAARLVSNHTNIVKFAARGCGAPGRRPVSAPLSDPSATPGEQYLDAVDAGELSLGITAASQPKNCRRCIACTAQRVLGKLLHAMTEHDWL